jgi:Tfp pilus assembly pilus retraction ATPase PilT
MVRGASDPLPALGCRRVVRVHGRLVQLDELPAVDGEELFRTFQEHLGPRARRELEEGGSTDFSLRLAAAARSEGGNRAFRFRVNLHRQRGELAGAVRALPSEIPNLAGLNLPPIFAELVKPSRGLVWSAASSTLAAMVAEISRTRTASLRRGPDRVRARLSRSLVEHVEVRARHPLVHEALRAAMRQVDVILVGGPRRPSVATALRRASGHRVLSTATPTTRNGRCTASSTSSAVTAGADRTSSPLAARGGGATAGAARRRGRVPAVLLAYAVRNHPRRLYGSATRNEAPGDDLAQSSQPSSARLA